MSHVNRWYALVHVHLWKKPKFVGRVNLIDIAEYPIEDISSQDLRDFSNSASDHLSDLKKIKTLKKLYLNHYRPVSV